MCRWSAPPRHAARSHPPSRSPDPFGLELRQDLAREALDLPELINRAEPANEVVDAAVAEPDDAVGCPLHDPPRLLGPGVAHQPGVRDDPARWRLLERRERRHLRPGAELDVVVPEVPALERGLLLGPELEQD